MTKSITSVLIGCALAENRIDSLDTPITSYLPELADGGFDGVSIRHIMQMRSSVDYEERYDFENQGVAASNHIAALVRNTARFADVARRTGCGSRRGRAVPRTTASAAMACSGG
jgi:CubicO group peptidase (beta-lactamase class C family)